MEFVGGERECVVVDLDSGCEDEANVVVAIVSCSAQTAVSPGHDQDDYLHTEVFERSVLCKRTRPRKRNNVERSRLKVVKHCNAVLELCEQRAKAAKASAEGAAKALLLIIKGRTEERERERDRAIGREEASDD